MPHDYAADAPVVSFDDEPLIVVDSDDRVLGYRTKLDCHRGEGVLHRAFSIFLFNGRGEVLLQQRSAQKPLWPGYWSNSCCSHPRRGESVDQAAVRRLREELSIDAALTYFYRFEYHARFGAGAEHELCSVYVARSDAPVAVNPNEVAACRFVSPAALDRELLDNGARYTPWLKLEWAQLRREHWARVVAAMQR